MQQRVTNATTTLIFLPALSCQSTLLHLLHAARNVWGGAGCCLLHLLHAASAVQHRAARSTDQGDTRDHHIDFFGLFGKRRLLGSAAWPIARAADAVASVGAAASCCATFGTGAGS
jgi:hypothetical protein